MTGIKIELLAWTLKLPLVKGLPAVFGQNVSYRREEDYLLYVKSAGSHFMLFMLFVKYS